MIPYLTPQGLALTLVAALALVGGVFAGSIYAVAAGQALVLWLSLTYLAVLSWPASFRRHGLYFSCSVPPSKRRTVVGATVRLAGRLHNATSLSLARTWPEIWCESGLAAEKMERALPVPRRSQVNFELPLVARAAGRQVLHGLSLVAEDPFGLVRLQLYFPQNRSITVAPAGTLKRRQAWPARGDDGFAGRRLSTSLGDGTELKEIRPHQPGDPFRSIEWKATGRAGKLMVRQFEGEGPATLFVVVDASATMRRGGRGQNKLDFALEAAQTMAREAGRRGDRVGLLAFDGRLVAQCPPEEGAPSRKFTDTLLGLVDAVDEDLTEVSDDELATSVARHLQYQAGFRLPRELRPDSPAAELVPHLAAAIARRPRASAIHPRAATPDLAQLRRYCWEVGLRLPYRDPPLAGTKQQGLQAALSQLRAFRQVHSLLVITDLEGLSPAQSSTNLWKQLRSPGRSWLVLVPPQINGDQDRTTPMSRSIARWGGRLVQARPGEPASG
jgi:uncharacterized protein (DUF58 family)